MAYEIGVDCAREEVVHAREQRLGRRRLHPEQLMMKYITHLNTLTTARNGAFILLFFLNKNNIIILKDPLVPHLHRRRHHIKICG